MLLTIVPGERKTKSVVHPSGSIHVETPGDRNEGGHLSQSIHGKIDNATNDDVGKKDACGTPL